MTTSKQVRTTRASRPYQPAMDASLAKPVKALMAEYDLSKVEAVKAIADRAQVAEGYLRDALPLPLDSVAAHWLHAVEVYRAHFAALAAGDRLTALQETLREAKALLGTDDDLLAAVAVLNGLDRLPVDEAIGAQVALFAGKQASTMGLTLECTDGVWGLSLYGGSQPAAPAAQAPSSNGNWVPHWLHALSVDWRAINEMTLPEAAEWYGRNGIPVVPRDPRDQKRPLVKGGYLTATTDIEQIRKWWRKWPDANIGITTGITYDVLDADYHPNEGQDGLADIAALEPYGLLAGVCAIATTPSGGEHRLFAPDDTRPYGARQGGKLGFALDLLGYKTSQTAPPSRNAAGQRYQWTAVTPEAYGPTIDWGTIVLLSRTVPQTPPTTLAAVTTNGTTNIDGLRRWLRGLTDGRNNAVYDLTWQLLREGHNPDVLLEDAAIAYNGDERGIERAKSAIKSAKAAFAEDKKS